MHSFLYCLPHSNSITFHVNPTHYPFFCLILKSISPVALYYIPIKCCICYASSSHCHRRRAYMSTQQRHHQALSSAIVNHSAVRSSSPSLVSPQCPSTGDKKEPSQMRGCQSVVCTIHRPSFTRKVSHTYALYYAMVSHPRTLTVLCCCVP